jgi:Lrp/AsnC family leucine-responsive transcriptional regulator
MIDNVDKIILQALQENARISNADLARRAELSPSAILTRVKRLEEQGYIGEYFTRLNRQLLGYDMMSFVGVTLQRHELEQVSEFDDAIARIPEVLECHHVTGDYDYLLKVIAKNTADLEQFLIHTLTPIKGVSRIHTSVVLSEVKASSTLPIS